MKDEHKEQLAKIAARLKGNDNNREMVMRAVKENGLALQYASDKLKDDYAVVKAAVQKNGMAIAFASDSMKRFEDLVSIAHDQDPAVLSLSGIKFEARDLAQAKQAAQLSKLLSDTKKAGKKPSASMLQKMIMAMQSVFSLVKNMLFSSSADSKSAPEVLSTTTSPMMEHIEGVQYDNADINDNALHANDMSHGDGHDDSEIEKDASNLPAYKMRDSFDDGRNSVDGDTPEIVLTVASEKIEDDEDEEGEGSGPSVTS